MCIYTGDNTLILRETMKDLEKRLDPRRFQRPPLDHRQPRPGQASEAAHQRRMFPGARSRAQVKVSRSRDVVARFVH